MDVDGGRGERERESIFLSNVYPSRLSIFLWMTQTMHIWASLVELNGLKKDTNLGKRHAEA